MIKLVNYLISLGFECQWYHNRSQQWKPGGNQLFFSSMDQGDGVSRLGYRLIKGEEGYYFGLHEMNHPPTLIHPRPRIKSHYETIKNQDGEQIMLITEFWDSAMDRVLKRETSEDIIEAIRTGTQFNYLSR